MFTQTEIDVLEKLQGEPLKRVLLKTFSPNKVGKPIRFDTIVFIFASGWIELKVDENTDQLLLKLGLSSYPGHQVETPPDIFENLIGRPLGWIWGAKNDRGYRDMVVMSFDGPIPELAFYGIASDIAVYRMNEVLA